MILSWKQIPNLVTFLRIVLVVPFALFLLNERFAEALVLFFIAGLSDGVDGYLARRFNWRSRFGAIADPLADKLLLVTAYAILAWMERIPVWLSAAVFARDILIVAGGVIYRLLFGPFEMTPTRLSKLNTVVQIVFVLAVIMHEAHWPMPDVVPTYGVWMVLSLTVVSGVHYIAVWGRKTLGPRPASRV